MTVALTGADRLAERIAAARAAMPAALANALDLAMNDGVEALRAAAPHGEGGGGSAPEGDAPGALADSFVSRVTLGGARARGVIHTTQPTKLRFVRYGTGIYGPSGQRIIPRVKRALFWSGADYPVRSVRGIPPNDFVSPVIPQIRDYAATRVRAAAAEITAALNGR